MKVEAHILWLKTRYAHLFLDGSKRIVITPDSLEKLVRHAYEAGYRDGEDSVAAKSLFESMFGKK